ncbi:MAG TPA: DUF692 family protein [Nitrospira sp.]|nr:DUF692 family protein [Nitrospira sp.]
MRSISEEFDRRIAAIPALGLGLSVDVYSPNLFDLMAELRRCGLSPGYLEIFKASANAMRTVRRRMPDVPLTYHGEGLWVTQPDFSRASFLADDLDQAATHLSILGSHWLNHECAAKQMAGYSFGTYLPPVYTEASARIVADNVALVQRQLDDRWGSGDAPLFLLEMAPLTYFGVGTIGAPQFFCLVTDRVACGLVLDIGHLWTLYRYTAAKEAGPLAEFVRQFLDAFPLERVVEIHVAGLAERPCREADGRHDVPPAWIDDHAAPIPPVLWQMLEQVLAQPRLQHLRAVALEVDTKSIGQIVDEFSQAGRRLGLAIRHKCAERPNPMHADAPAAPRREAAGGSEADYSQLADAYRRYARIISAQEKPAGVEWQSVQRGGGELMRYIDDYLPQEILSWGGDVAEMFPDTSRALARELVPLDRFVTWWFNKPRPTDQTYDFFLLKIARFVEFVADAAPGLRSLAEREADILRAGYAEANEAVGGSACIKAATG